ncbi:(2,3-dihydroxybenzoyl)adenylate synthase [Roseateles sp. DB2]|uniref:(2,3-dihydroxybenzoyl)adenylate synthase n=1 Tax=Roseateles sp. DB2 TaxID=3453717 RepID=UPI003EEB13F3
MSAQLARPQRIEFTPWPPEQASQYRQAGYWLDRPLGALLADGLAAAPDATALICGERQFSYRDMAQAVERLAARLWALGLRQHDTALVQLPNVAEFYLVFFALLRLGVVPVNALFSHKRHELQAYAVQVRPRLLIADRAHPLFADETFLAALQQEHPQLEQVLLRGETAGPRSLAQALHSPMPSAWPGDAGPTPPDEVAFFQLSGGSTGTPKLIPRTHNDYDYSVRRSAELCRLGPQTRYLCALPAAHNFPLSSPGALGVFHAGGCVVLAGSPEPLACFELIERHELTMTGLVPSAVSLWMQAVLDMPARRRQLQTLGLLQVGGASFAESLARRVPEVLGCRLQQVFGMAEGLVNYTRLDDEEARIMGTQGRPMSPADEVQVRDPQGLPVPPGEVGLLATRGPYTFRGYYRSPEHNQRVFDAQGFYCSGDLVRQTAQGDLCVVGRVKDQINRGGEKIAAEEIEDLLLRHADIRQVGVIAVPDQRLGEKSCACFVSGRSDLGAPALRRFLREQGVADYKVPDRFERLPALPLTAVGKIDKQALRVLVATVAPHSQAREIP